MKTICRYSVVSVLGFIATALGVVAAILWFAH